MAQGSRVDICSLVCSEDRDFLVRNCGAEVDIRSLRGKIVGLYFCASRCRTSRKFTPTLSDVYLDLFGSKSNHFQVVLVSLDRDEAAFNGQFCRMPWLAVPFSDTPTIKRLEAHFNVKETPLLVLIGAGVVLTTQGVRITEEYKRQLLDSVKGQPPTSMELRMKKNDLLDSLFRKKKIVSELGKMAAIALCFTGNASYDAWDGLTKKLFELFHNVNVTADDYQVVMIYLNDKEEDEVVVEEDKTEIKDNNQSEIEEGKDDETKEENKESFEKPVAKKPFLPLGLRQDAINKLFDRFEQKNIPWLVMIGRGGKTFSLDATKLVNEYVAEAYPSTQEKRAQLIERSTLEGQTLESLLGSGKGYVHDNKEQQVKVSDLTQRHVLLYFSALWSPEGCAFTPELSKAYSQIKGNHSDFEVIYISSDRDYPAFKEHHSRMDWLALPYCDKQLCSLLTKKFNVEEIPTLVYIGIDSQTVNAKARELVLEYGAGAFPFTDERVKELEMMKQQQGEICPSA